MTTEIHGFCEDRFKPLEEAFRANFEAGREIGASLGVTWRGKLVVDLWGGYAEPDRSRPWAGDTIACIFSATKIPLTLSTLVLVSRGLIELDAPVARYWPEFAQGGKEAVTIRQALTHQAGVPGYDPPLTYEDIKDWDRVTANIAAQPHRFGGEARLCYHFSTYGFILGEVIRRVDGRRPTQFFREEIAEPLGADIRLSFDSRPDFPRRANFQWPSVMLPPAGDEFLAYVMGSVLFSPDETWENLSVEIPAGSGYANGRSLAQLCAIVAMGGEVGGVRYLSPAAAAEVVREQVNGQDPFMGPLRLGLGFGLHSPLYPAPSPTCAHWGGYGGSWGLADPATALSLGYVPNNLILDPELVGLDPRLAQLSAALEDLLPKL